MNIGDRRPGVFYRFLGGIFGACTGAVLGIGVAAIVDTMTAHEIGLGWGTSITIGAIGGLLLGVAFPTVGEIVAHIISMFTP